jgi:hypothetical protein
MEDVADPAMQHRPTVAEIVAALRDASPQSTEQLADWRRVAREKAQRIDDVANDAATCCRGRCPLTVILKLSCDEVSDLGSCSDTERDAVLEMLWREAVLVLEEPNDAVEGIVAAARETHGLSAADVSVRVDTIMHLVGAPAAATRASSWCSVQ